MKNTAPYSAALRKKIAALPDENGREANSPIGSIGSAARRSHSTNATASSAPDGQRRDHLDAAPAGRVAAHEPPNDARARRR